MPQRDSKAHISFTDKELPEIKDWTIGEKIYNLHIRVRMCEKRKPFEFEAERRGGNLIGGFEIDSVKDISESEDVTRLKNKLR